MRVHTHHVVLMMLGLALASIAASLALPAAVGAYATPGPEPVFSTSPGLPDGRVYEMASPPNKHGYEAGANVAPTEGNQTQDFGSEGQPFLSVASPDGNAVSFGSAGPAAEVNASGLSQVFVANRATGGGWTSHSDMARGRELNEIAGLFGQNPYWLDFSSDLSHLAYVVFAPQVPGPPQASFVNFYLSGPDPMAAPTWLARPQIPAPEYGYGLTPVGGAPDLSSVYFTYSQKLLPGEESRIGWGFYEYRNGKLSPAGVLPDGTVPTGGAVPSAMTPTENFRRENTPDATANEVSIDGKRAFFVSPDPEFVEGAGAKIQLYVRKTEADESQNTLLVSGSQLSGHIGEAASDGAMPMGNPARNAENEASRPTYSFASPDGSHVFFRSIDRLVSAAPNDTAPKTYDFNVETRELEYLPSLNGEIVISTADGSSVYFVDPAASPAQLDRWSQGPEGGSATSVAQLPGGGYLGPARLSSDDSILVFQAEAPIPGFNDGGSHLNHGGERTSGAEQIFRYDAATNALSCVSCPPHGVTPSGPSYISEIDQYQNVFGILGGTSGVNDDRGVSADGSHVFFDTPDPLVPQDTNGKRDVYEWEDGKVFLLSTGTSTEASFLLDNSESGNDVFFATVDELHQGDNDEAFDVYDARVPRPGDSPPPSAVPCQGDVCQGPPSEPALLGTPASATFNGLGNLAPVARTSASKPAKRAKPRKPKKAVKRHRKTKTKKLKRADKTNGRRK
jgi:hypothetical protein